MADVFESQGDALVRDIVKRFDNTHWSSSTKCACMKQVLVSDRASIRINGSWELQTEIWGLWNRKPGVCSKRAIMNEPHQQPLE